MLNIFPLPVRVFRIQPFISWIINIFPVLRSIYEIRSLEELVLGASLNKAVGESNAIVRELDEDVPEGRNISNVVLVNGKADDNIYLKMMLTSMTFGA